MLGSFRLVALIVGIMSLMPLGASAQPAPAMPPGTEVPQQSAFSEAQLDQLTEMIIDARGEAEAVGVTFTPIVSYPINWTI